MNICTYVCRGRGLSDVAYKGTNPIKSGSHPYELTLITSLKALFPNIATLGVRVSTQQSGSRHFYSVTYNKSMLQHFNKAVIFQTEHIFFPTSYKDSNLSALLLLCFDYSHSSDIKWALLEILICISLLMLSLLCVLIGHLLMFLAEMSIHIFCPL